MISHITQGTSIIGPDPKTAGGGRHYYMYDGKPVLSEAKERGPGARPHRHQLVRPAADLERRIGPAPGHPAGAQRRLRARNMAFIADRQGTTLAAVDPSGLRDETAAFFGRNVFGQLEGASGTGSGSNPETGFTGASTPNQTGGFTYLRNRWYDPQSGRFLTQDPIGLAGGVNLYAYAGNNPVSFSDPYGLAPCCKLRDIAAMLIGFVPVVGDANDAVAAVSGQDVVSGERLSAGGRVTAAAGVLLPVSGGHIRGALAAGKEALSKLIKDASTNPDGWRTVGAFTEAATNKAAKGGVSVQEVVENGGGDQLVRHTVVDQAGNAVDGPHYRPNYQPRDVDKQ